MFQCTKFELPVLFCRGDFGIDVGRNIIHGSDGVEVSSAA